MQSKFHDLSLPCYHSCDCEAAKAQPGNSDEKSVITWAPLRKENRRLLNRREGKAADGRKMSPIRNFQDDLYYSEEACRARAIRYDQGLI